MRRIRTSAVVAGVYLGVLGAGYVCLEAKIRYNHSPSMPKGIWLERSTEGHIFAAGDIVAVCPPLTAWQRIYLESGPCQTGLEPILKPIVAVAGDTVIVSTAGVSINGTPAPDSTPLTHDRWGHALAAWPAGTYTVAPGQAWLLAPMPDSLDSRYLGPVEIGYVQALATPMVVWK
jgi:conjugative transfer signal peptidase TraF